MMLIENDKRGKDFSVRVTYSTQSRKVLYPENRYIRTMNTQPVSCIVDYALRKDLFLLMLNPLLALRDLRVFRSKCL